MLTLVARTGQLGYLAALCTFHAPYIFGLVGQMHLASHPPCAPPPSSCGPPPSAAPKLWTTTSQLAPLVLAMLMSTHLARPNPFLGAADAGGLPFPGGLLPGGLTRGDLEVLLHLPLPVCLYGWSILLHGDTAELWCGFVVAACAWCVRTLSLLAAPRSTSKSTLRCADPPALCCGRTGRSRTGSEARSSQPSPRPCLLQALARHRPDLHRDAVVDRHVVPGRRPGRHRARVWLARALLRREHIM